MCYKNCISCEYYRNIFISLHKIYGTNKRFTLKDARTKIKEYTNEIHRKFTSNEIIKCVDKIPYGVNIYSINKDATTMLTVKPKRQH
jgi:hypothetical protein